LSEESSMQENRALSAFEVLEQLKGQLDEFEKMRKGMQAKIASAAKLGPSLEKEKGRLKDDIQQKQEKIAQINKLIPQLEKEKKKLQEDVEQKQEQISKIDEQVKLILWARKYEM